MDNTPPSYTDHPASPAHDFLDSVGINTHLNAKTTSYNDVDMVVASLKYVGIQSIETQVTPQTPPTFLVHAADNPRVPIKQSELMYAALQKAGVPSAFHNYPHGGHGFGYGKTPDISPPAGSTKHMPGSRAKALCPDQDGVLTKKPRP